MGTDVGQAREQAKIRALGDLARNVRVTVRSVLVDVLGQAAGQPRQSLEWRIDAYADIPPTQLDREEFVMNHPRRGQLTCRLAVNRARYDGDVRRDLLNKKNRATEEAHRAHTALRDGRLADAWRALESLQARAAQDFPNLLLEGDPDGDGKPEDVLAWSRTKRETIRGGLHIACSPETIIFDRNGHYGEGPRARLTWSGVGPGVVKDIPLRARWTHRPDHKVEESVTDQAGKALFHPAVDLFVDSSLLQIELDGDGGERPVACQIEFHKRRQAVLVVHSDRDEVRAKLEEETISRLKRFPWDVRADQDYSGAGGETTLLLESRTTVVRHPDGNIHRATVDTVAELRSGVSGKTVFQGKGPVGVGFGGTPGDGVRRALNDLIPKLGPWLEEKVKDLP